MTSGMPTRIDTIPRGAWVIPIKSDECTSVQLVGGKAAGLAAMTREGHAVPEGVVITTHFFRALMQLIDPSGSLRASAASDEHARVTLATSIRSTILPVALKTELCQAASCLSFPVAVRSSATAEDLASKSFAGAYDTIKDISGFEQLTSAILQCLASFFEETPVKARHSLGIEDASMAVIIQRMVPATLAGTLFTANPITGYPRDVLIECAAGDGDSVVKGRRLLESVVIDRDDHSVLSRESSAPRHEPMLSPTADPLSSLLIGAGKLQQTHGASLDIEWAFDGDTVHFLQVRPMTALPAAVLEVIYWQPKITRDYGVQYSEISIRSLGPDSTSPHRFSDQVWIPDDGDVTCLIGERSWHRFLQACKTRISLSFDAFVSEFYTTAKAYVATAESLTLDQLETLDISALAAAYLRYQDTAVRYCTLIWTTFLANPIAAEAADLVIEARFAGHPDEESIRSAALAPAGLDARAELVREATRADLDNSRVRELFDRFRWWDCRDLHDTPYSFERFEALIASLRSGETLQNSYDWSSLSDEERSLIARAQQLTLIKDLRDNFRCRGVYSARSTLFVELSRRIGCEVGDLSFFTQAELLHALATRGRELPNVAERRAGFAIGFKDDLRCHSGQELAAFIEQHDLPTLQTPDAGVVELYGVAAQRGRAKGRARIVRRPEDCVRVAKGDILVARTTDTGYLDAFYRASAIVTDEGGRTCHAAIWSRELGLPCVTATDKSTRVISDGAIIEVIATASRGLVRLI